MARTLLSRSLSVKIPTGFLKKFDVVVVGAGTGGCLAAKTVAQAGFDVRLVDRKMEQDIGDKVCGDA